MQGKIDNYMFPGNVIYHIHCRNNTLVKKNFYPFPLQDRICNSADDMIRKYLQKYAGIKIKARKNTNNIIRTYMLKS